MIVMTKEISCDYACWNSSNDWYTGVYQIITDIHNTSNKLYAITWTSQQHHNVSNQRQSVTVVQQLVQPYNKWTTHHSAVLLVCCKGNSPNGQRVFSTCFNDEMPYLKGLTKFRANSRHVMSKRMKRHMMTSSNGNIFRITGLLCGEFTGHRWIPCTKASDAALWCPLWSARE